MQIQASRLRKYLFYGITLILASAFILLTIQGRRIEEKRKRQGTEIVQNFKPIPIRVLAPQDLEITTASMALEPGDETRQSHAARHRIEIRNTGTVSYGEIQLSLDYMDAGGGVLESIPYNINKPISPGNAFLLSDLLMENIPAETADCRLSITYADIEQEP
jgi:hypothetical protein